MVNKLDFDTNNTSYVLTSADIQRLQAARNQDGTSIFMNEDKNVQLLEEALNNAQSDDGVILNAWDSFKGKVGIGTSSEKCDEIIEKYKNGEVTFEEAMNEIDNYDNKQDSSLNLFSNIVTGIAAIGAVAAVTALTGGAALPILAAVGIGAGAGAVTKTAFKFTDRATNDVEGDALDAKQMAQDALSGAVTGGIAAATTGTGQGVFNAQREAGLSRHILNGAARSAKTGMKTGAIACGANYAIDCAFEEDKKFNTGEFARVVLEGSAVGAAVGAIMGGVNGGLRHEGILYASDSNVAANSASSASYKIVNDRIRNIAA